MVYCQYITGLLHLSCSQVFPLKVAFTNTTGSFSLLSVAINFGVEGLTSDTFASVCVFVCRSLYLT